MKNLIVIIVAFLIFSCKEKANKTEKDNVVETETVESEQSKNEPKIKEHGEIFEIKLTKKTVVEMSLDSIQIAEMKKKYGVNDVYAAGDDIMWYTGQMLEVIDSLGIDYVHTLKRKVLITTPKGQLEVNNDTPDPQQRYFYFNGEEILETDLFELIALNNSNQ